MKKYRKYFVITLVAAFGILTGLNLKNLIILNFKLEGNYQVFITTLTYFSLTIVMLYEWIKILKDENKLNKN